ncbi:hypothetical protein HIM_06628 [Hirsutella minnesotensis 3608]|uniref:Uncharacterized protein n=1 Tax=Hirsutella minnesotensis 3608 TaxID=1043627 RepID=A0A0F7ZNL5_9HYPO|nr:hypothetical protein HIM_06628 [Hirsutella minnesotensis 3608]
MKASLIFAAVASIAMAATPEATDCPRPGTSDSLGRYSCNPNRQYPEGRTCEQVGDCYFLSPLEDKVVKTNATTEPVVLTAGAAPLRGAGVLALAALGAFL